MSQEEQTIKLDQRDVLDAAMTAGHILLENGAEIFRVEETIDRICHHFGVQSENAFVLSNGIFLTSGDEHEKRFARVEHIPVRGAQLHRVAAVNQLSRERRRGEVKVRKGGGTLGGFQAIFRFTATLLCRLDSDTPIR